jgi:hypothetical protein
VNDRREFVAALRGERERRGITLDEVAEQTKINVALLAALERGDLSRWPTGIFRRAFVRSYAVCIGLDADTVVATFSRCFPERGDGGIVSVPAFERPAAGADGLRLTLASHPRPSMRTLGLRSLAVCLDLLAVGGAGAIVAVTGLAPFSVAALTAAAVYFTAGTLTLEVSPGWWLARRSVRGRQMAQGVQPEAIRGAAADTEDALVRRPSPELSVRPGRRDRRGVRAERQRGGRGARRVL